MRLGRDGIAGLVVLAASVALAWITREIQGNPLVQVGPEFYPRVVLGVTIFLSVLLVGEDLLASRRGPAPKAGRPNYALVAGTFAVFTTYVLALPYLGFRAASFLFVAALCALLEPPRTARRWLGVALLAAGTTVVAWLVFERYLLVLLPRGRWTGF